jgi:large subunit ribosomal protein L4
MGQRGTEPLEEVAPDAFGDPPENLEILHRALRNHAQNSRQATQSTKTRGEVAASTAKLYRQKGTGRARAGSSSAVQRVGGGVAHGPRPRRVRRRMSRRERRGALRAALAAKAASRRIQVAQSWGEAAKTRERAEWLDRHGLTGRVLLVDIEPSAELRTLNRNIRGVEVVRADSLTVHAVASVDTMVTTPAALEYLRSRSAHGSG